MEPELVKGGKRITELEQYEDGGESDRTYPITKKKKKQIDLQGEFRKITPPTFDGEKEEDVEAWLLNMTNYL